MLGLLLLLLILGPCASDDDEALFCEGAPCVRPDDGAGVGGAGGSGGAGGEAVSSTSASEGSTSSGLGGAEQGGGGAGDGGTGGSPSASATSSAASTSSSTSTSGNGGGPVGPACGSDAACRIPSACPGTAPPCPACQEGLCVEGHCAQRDINDDSWGCIVTDPGSPRNGREGRCSAGTCLDFTPVRCETADGTFVGCDGQEHPSTEYWSISFGERPFAGDCTGSPVEVEFCAPGAACQVVYIYNPETGDTKSIAGTCR
ncbi:hypothetical protein WME88_27590 [Sorangium sp. So ce216]